MFARISLSCTNLPKYSNIRAYNHFCSNNIYNKLKTTNQLIPTKPLLTIPTNNGLIQRYRLKQEGGNSTTPASGSLQAIRLWNSIFGKYLLITNIVGSGVLMVVGDVIAQEIEYRRGDQNNGNRYDWPRMGRMFIVGALQGPLHHYVYNWMDKIMPVANIRNTIRKILIDQIFMSPACIFIFFYSACCLEGKTLTETNDELRDKFLFIYCMDWLLWPGAQYFNFRYLDTKYRVTFVNVCTCIYNIFMSYMKHDFDQKV